MNDYISLEPDAEEERGVDFCEHGLEPTAEEEAKGVLLGKQINTEDDGDIGFTKSVALRAVSEHDRAMAKARAMKQVLLSYGVPEVSIELQQGRPSSYGTWDALFTVADMSHHTVSRYSASSLTPVLWLCKSGRTDVPGPLCNGYGGYDLCYRIITFGYANHSGYGGPITVPALTAGTFTIPKDSGRRYLWGTEWEGGLDTRDWDRILTNPRNGKKMTMREFMGRVNAGLEKFLEIHERAHLEHSTWTTRKIDRLGYTAARGISEKSPYRSGTTTTTTSTAGDGLDMDAKEVRSIVRSEIGKAPIIVGWDDKGNPKTWQLNRVMRSLLNDESQLKAALANNNAKLVNAIVAALPQTVAGASDLTEDQLRAAVEKGIRNVLGGLDEE